jgi:cephalosporin hydroxylase
MNLVPHPISQFAKEREARIESYAHDDTFSRLSLDWTRESMARMYVYNFDWLGRPIIQYPQDIVAFQEIVWRVKPDLIIETGIAHGGSLVLSASLLALLDLCEEETNDTPETGKLKRKVLGIDIDIRAHNKAAIEAHPLSKRIEMIEGSSTSVEVLDRVRTIAKGYPNILVCLDSNHTHEHVLAELNGYAPLVTVGSYCIVFDTVVENLPKDFFANRPWNPGNSPKSAVCEYLKGDTPFEIDSGVHAKLGVTVAPGGYLRRVR